MKKTYILLSLIFVLLQSNNAQRTITGFISDSEGEALPGVSIQAKGTSIATMSLTDGTYSITVTPYVNVLIFSYIGMKTVEKEIEHDAINVMMYPDDSEIDEVVVNSLGKKMDGLKTEYEDAPMFGSVRSLTDKSMITHVYSESDDKIVTGYKDETGEGISNNVKSGLLTAGELNDYGKWELWQDITAGELKTYKTIWKMMPQDRYCIQVINYSDRPVVNARVYLKNKEGEIIWTALSDNTGKAELWANLYDSTVTSKNIYIEVKSEGQTFKLSNPQKFNDGINFINIPVQCSKPSRANIAFVVDATGSMGDEIAYLQAELADVLTKIKKNHKNVNINTASVFYRDKTDSYLVQKSDFTDNINTTHDFINLQGAGGGGDFPEAVDAGLNTAINELKWTEGSLANVIFLILDAPPHNDSESIKNMQDLTKKAAEKGIKIVPVTASGIDKSTEYLMRSIALATNGTYVFLTDDSGIGNSHIKPTTDEYRVEFLNEVFIRLIKQYLTIPECEEDIEYNPEEIQDTSFITDNSLNQDTLLMGDTLVSDTGKVNIIIPKEPGKVKYWPNPTKDIVNIEISGNLKEMFLTDVSGKILQRFNINNQNTFTINIGQYPAGIYFLQYQNGERWQTGKIILTNNI